MLLMNSKEHKQASVKRTHTQTYNAVLLCLLQNKAIKMYKCLLVVVIIEIIPSGISTFRVLLFWRSCFIVW